MPVINKKFSLKADKKNLDLLNNFFEEQFEQLNLPTELLFPIELSFEEIYVNICNYAYPDKTGKVDIEVFIDDNNIKIILIDKGLPYNPLTKEDPDTTLAIEDRQIGGLGIFLTKQYMDDFIYEYKNNQNINILIKKLK